MSPTDKLNIAVVGIGGMGHSNINAVKGTENIVALCDVNWDYAKGVFDELPKAKRYWDYRKMYDEMANEIDAVIIATADHTHAIITADAMTMGKHVFCQKPLTHSVYESRPLTKLAASTGVATQMGSRGSSWDGTATVCDWIWNGEIGDVYKVECAPDRPIWPQGLNAPEKEDKIPEDFELGSLYRSCKAQTVQPYLSALELAWLVGIRNRSSRRYGLPYFAPALQSSES